MSAENKSESQDSTSFEDIVARLEQIGRSLEGGDIKLEESLALFEEGVRLSKLANRKLDEAEKKLEVLLADDTTAPLDLANGNDDV